MEVFIGSVHTVGFNFAPRGFATCSGGIMPINDNTALFALMGTTFGGNGRSDFGLPDLRGRSVVGVGSGPALSTITWGMRAGDETTQLGISHLPVHNHAAAFTPDGGSGGAVEVYVQASSKAGDTSAKDGSYLANVASGPTMQNAYASNPSPSDLVTLSGVYATGGGSASGTVTVGNTGRSIPFDIRNPYLGMYQVIATVGVFPSRN
ncbi:phage tail protein [Photobacterium rosenbergii]|uniref:Tail fiber protein n=1 Tax=Photobacterium rosenbergii TaxID=294936 RepID=A0ABU3ZR03_9GAMM|nr:tail fiber protein [Photobacterium rosenbergii]MDV5172541.1 tail fiber protein [Photobacterium rosenbergii]